MTHKKTRRWKSTLLFIALLVLTSICPFAMPFAESFSHLQVDKQVRALHFVLRAVSLSRAKWIVDQAKETGFNTIVVCITDGVVLDHAPWQARENAWSKEDFSSWVNYARGKGMTLVPEVKLLTHQHLFFQGQHPSLMFNKSTYDPRKPEVYQLVFAFLDEIIEAIHPIAIHIGHDEVAGHHERSKKKWLLPGEVMLPADLFLKDIKEINSYLNQRGIQTWMWGDMLISPDEFPRMLNNHLHGAANGYGKKVRNQLPRDIVICDWHYFDDQQEFPSLSVMREEGFKIIGATWKKKKTIRNFALYAAAQNAYGMMATTWWHVQREEWDVVDRIIHESGDHFAQAFGK